MISDIAKAAAQLGDPPIRKRIGLSIALALGVMVALWALSAALLSLVNFEAIPYLPGWAADLLAGAGFVAIVFLTFLFFSAIVAGVGSLFLDGVCAAVEAKHYPGASAGREQPLGEALISTAKFIGLALLLNLLALPLYLIFPPIFLVVNGYLVGREFFELAALRHRSAAETTELRRSHRLQLLLLGAALAFLLTIPIINLIAPVIAAAAMTHRFHALTAAA
ncbi:MAG: EI24 domain-containing protein [Pseudomonadota bacterium]